MRLEIGNFHVKRLVFSDCTEFRDGVLSINKEDALRVVREDARITEADLAFACPGDDIRICPVKEAIEPRVRPDGQCVFPGYTGGLRACGQGMLHALKGTSVLAVGRHWGGFQDGLIDMSGAGAKYSYFSTLQNIVLIADTNEEEERYEQQKTNAALRLAGHRLAEYLGQCVKELTPEDTEVYDLPPLCRREGVSDLPKVAYVMQVQSQMEQPGYNTLAYGWDTNHLLPTLLHPNEVLDGALVSGSFMPCSSKWSTYDLQNCPNIKALYQEHGKSIDFIGVILSNLNTALDQKERSAQVVTQLLTTLGADAAIVAEEGYGNPDADFVTCIAALESAGIKTIGVTNECTGRDGRSQPLVTLDQKLDAIVSCGNVSELIELPSMPVVLGELEALGRDGLSGGWANDELLGPSVRPDGSIIMENNAMFCGDQVCGWSKKTMLDY